MPFTFTLIGLLSDLAYDGGASPPPPPPPPPPPAVPLAVTVSPNYAYGERSGPGYVETWKCQLRATGGVEPYTYTVTYDSGDTLTKTTADDEVWFSASILNGRTLTADYTWSVTDYDYTEVTGSLTATLVSNATGPTGPGGGTAPDPELPPGTPPPGPVTPTVPDVVIFATPEYAYGERTGDGDVTTDTVFLNISGGVPPYTISTAYTIGDSFTINGGTTTSLSFTKTGGVEGDNFLGYYTVTATDVEGRIDTLVVSAQIRVWEETPTSPPTPPSPPPPPPPPPAALSASISPVYAYGERTGFGSATTNSCVVTASGGTPPYTYSVTRSSGVSFTINGGTTGTFSFTGTIAADTTNDGYYTWTVTDSAAASVSGAVTATLVSYPIDSPGGALDP